MRTLEELKKQRDETAELEREVLEDIQAKAVLLGMMLVPANGEPQVPKQKRKRRSKAEIEADKSRMPSNEL